MRRLLPLLLGLFVPLAAAGNIEDCMCYPAEPSVAEQALDVASSPAVAWGVGGAAVAGVAFLGARRGWWRALPAVLPLWTRIGPDRAAQHPTRARLLALVRERPGVSTADLVSASGLNESTMLYHLDRLERSGYAKSVRAGRDRVWYEAAAPRPDAARLKALHAPSRQQLLEAVLREPGLAKGEYAMMLGVAKATVHHHFAELERAGLVVCVRDGLRVRCWPVARTAP